MLPTYFCHVPFMKISTCVYWNLWYSLSILKVTFLKSNSFRFKETLIRSISNKNGTTRKEVQLGTVLREMLIKSTFNQTNFWLIFFSILWHKIWVLIYIICSYLRRLVIQNSLKCTETLQIFFRSASKSDRFFYI
jgi:hypothetical protein